MPSPDGRDRPLHAPDAAKVKVEQADGRVGNLFELFLQCSRQEQAFLKPVDALQSLQHPSLPLFGPLPFGDIGGGAKADNVAAWLRIHRSLGVDPQRRPIGFSQSIFGGHFLRQRAYPVFSDSRTDGKSSGWT